MRATSIGSLCGILLFLGASTVASAQPAGCESDRATITVQRGTIFEDASVSQGQWYWKLIEAVWCEPVPGGLKINIFYRVKDAGGAYITNQECIAGWDHSTYPNPPPNQVSIFTKAFPDWGDYNMAGDNWCPAWPTGGNGPYSAWVDDNCPANGSSCPPQASYPSDTVWGMGLPCNQHESYYLTWQFTQAAGTPSPTISVVPSGFSRTVTVGEDLPNDPFTVQNTGGGTLDYSITDGAGWLSVNPPNGTSTGSANPHNIIYSTASLPLGGPYNATVTVSDPNATNDPVDIPVSVTVVPIVVPGDFDGDGDVDLGDFGRFQACLSGVGIPQDDPDCAKAKMDDGPDVDQDDLNKFLGCLSGAGVLGDPDCAD